MLWLRRKGNSFVSWTGRFPACAGSGLPVTFLILVFALTLACIPVMGDEDPPEFTDSVSREISFFFDPLMGFVPFVDAVSREIVLYNDPLVGPVNITDAFSREITLLNDPFSGPLQINNAISREIVLYNDPFVGPVPIANVVSRELTVNNDPSIAVPLVDVISREITVNNRPVDNQPPNTTITSGPTEGSSICPGNVTFQFTGTDDISPVYELTYRWRLNGGEWTEFSSETSATISGLISGQHTFEVAARDYAGNIDPTPATRTFTIDTVPPVITGVSVLPSASSAVITWTTNEPASSLVRYGTSSPPTTESTFSPTLRTSHSVTISNLTEETRYYFQVVSADKCGHESESAIASFVTQTAIIPPQIAEIPDAFADEGVAYTGPTPVLIKGDSPITWTLVTGPQGMMINPATGVVSWAKTIGAEIPHVITIMATNSGGSDTETWELTVLPTYEAAVSTNIDIAPSGTPIPLSGSAWKISTGDPAPDVPVTILIKVKGTVREIPVQTNAFGNFQTVFHPLPKEAGAYTIGARHPGVTTDPIQDDFILVGMDTHPSTVSHTLVPGVEIYNEVELDNLGDTPLSEVTATAINVPSYMNIDVSVPSELDPLETTTLGYTILSTGSSWSGTVIIRVTSVEGAVADLNLNLSVRPPVPALSASPSSLNTGMLRGAQTFVQFQVTNTGGATTAELPVAIPSVSWMSLVSPQYISPIAPGESASVVLSLTPPANLELGPYSGTIVVGSGTGYGIQVPFTFICVSDGVGDLRVIAEDEYTYYAPGNPGLAGAKVTLTDPVTKQGVVEGITGVDGSILFQDLPEAYYDLKVTAEKHNSYQAPVKVVNGELTTVRAFLPLQLVTYRFTVSPVTIDDRYDIRLEAVFETNVPAPVVVVEPGYFDIRNLTQPRQQNFRVSNHGLINAQNVRVSGRSGGGIRVTPLVRNLGDLGPQQSFDIPVSFEPDPDSSGGGSCSRAELIFTYDLVCGIPRAYSIGVQLDQQLAQCPGGTWLVGGGGGGGVLRPVSFPPVIAQPVNCDPCDLERLKVLLGCVIDFIPINPCISTVLGVRDCWNCAWETNPDRVNCAIGCYGTMLNAADCAGASIPYVGHILTTVKCLYNLYYACDNLPGTGQGSALVVSGLDEGESVVSNVEYVRIHADRLQALSDAHEELFGDPVWLEGTPAEGHLMEFLLEAIKNVQSPDSPDGPWISQAERNALLNIELPFQLSAADVNKYVDRWNRTLDYWSAGIFNEADVPSGSNPDFIALDRLKAKWDAAHDAMAANLAEGFDSVFAGALYAAQIVRFDIEESSKEEGICARVRLQVDQRAVISRSAFQATLELDNAGESPLEDIFVSLMIHDQNGMPANDLFGITAPELSGISSIDGNGILNPGVNGIVNWTIIPTDDAAVEDETIYTVGGILSYTLDGAQFDIPLYPSRITVLPNPKLHLKYFWQKDVYSDDPFTPEIEPAEPFTLGLLIENRGLGTANNIRITTSQPEIIENESGLLIDFTIIGTQINDQEVKPSLKIDLGDLGPGSTSVARWLMVSSLQGKFISYSASFEHLDGLGDDRLSLIDEVSIHELIHAVRVVDPEDDGKPDFLTNDFPDVDSLPDRLHNSDGTVSPVSIGQNPVLTGSLTPLNRQVTLTAAVQSGFVYITADEPGREEYTLVRVVRSDGREIIMQDNAWTTHRNIRLQGQPVIREHRVHIFDYNSTGSYTLYYELAVPETLMPGQVKTNADGVSVEIGAGTGVVVTAVFPDGFYVSAPDRSSAIKVTGRTADEGDLVSISGTLSTSSNDERVVVASSVNKVGTGSVEPLTMNIRTLYSGDFQHHPDTGAGQRGMTGGSGLNTIGQLVRVTGRIISVDGDGFTIESGPNGHSVKVLTPAGVDAPALLSTVTVTGIASCQKQGEVLDPVLRIRRASDITAVTVGPIISSLQVTNISINSATVTWETNVNASTEVRLGETSGVYNRTLTVPGNVKNHSVVIDGLEPNTQYYFVVVSKDPLTEITSTSPEQSFQAQDWGNVAEAKLTENGQFINLSALIVTGVFDGFFYVQRPDRAGAGLRVEWNGMVLPDRAVDISGLIGTNPDGERRIIASSVVDRGSYSAQPATILGRTVGGGPIILDPPGTIRQTAVSIHRWLLGQLLPAPAEEMVGLSNIGLLIRTAGVVSNVGDGVFYLDDGSGYGDPLSSGIRVVLPSGISAPDSGSFVIVTGISSMYRQDNRSWRLVLVPTADGISVTASN